MVFSLWVGFLLLPPDGLESLVSDLHGIPNHVSDLKQDGNCTKLLIVMQIGRGLIRRPWVLGSQLRSKKGSAEICKSGKLLLSFISCNFRFLLYFRYSLFWILFFLSSPLGINERGEKAPNLHVTRSSDLQVCIHFISSFFLAWC